MRSRWTFVVCISGSLLSMTALSADHPADCTAFSAGQQRLACYDSFFMSEVGVADVMPEAEVPRRLSPIQARRRDELETRDNRFALTPHRPNYLLPATYNASADYAPYGGIGEFFSDVEIKFQLSLKSILATGLWRNSALSVGYTQQSYWQLYADDELSAPFRETNHEPEIMWSVPVSFEFLGFRGRLVQLALNHQSNGRARPLSRGWNRITGELVMERNRFALSAKTWIPFKEEELEDGSQVGDFMGRIQLGVAYKGDRHTIALGLKNSFDSDLRSGVEFNWMFPISDQVKGFVQLYSGYGENLIDMQNYNNRIGIGIALTDWL